MSTSRSVLTEMPWPSTYQEDGHTIRDRYDVVYYATTPNGTASRFTRNGNTSQLSGARGPVRSETQVRSYLQRLHPKCSIEIQSLEFS